MAIIQTSTDGLRKLNNVYDGLLECESMPPLPNGFPRYLFRGERDGYPNTLTSMDRLYHGTSENESIYDELDDLTAFVMRQPFPAKDLKGREAGVYAQHYGLPTQIFDFTSSAKIAIAFAANRVNQAAKGGNIAILDVYTAMQNGCVIDDLRNNKYAKRAHVQSAFGVLYTGFRADDFYSLKDEIIANNMGLIWVPFVHLENDEAFLKDIGADNDILSTNGDPFAGLAQEFVDEYVKRSGGFSVDAAKLLSEAVPAVNRSEDENFSRWKK